MEKFESRTLPEKPDEKAPDGSDVRVLIRNRRGSMAHFSLHPGEVSLAVTHRTVEELWYILSGEGEMWRKQGEEEEITRLLPGTALSIPLGTSFQFRSTGEGALEAVAVTMPPWPDGEEAIPVQGYWRS